MAPSPELGGQPKAPDKTGAETSNAAVIPLPETSSTSGNNPQMSSLSGTKSSFPGGTTTSNLSSSSGSSSNNNTSGGSSTTAGTAATTSQQAPQQDSSKLDNMAESDLKALLEEAITYKCPKDRQHKSAVFNALLSKTEMEDQEQNFSFTSRAVQSKRASGRPTQGGSLQDLQEASMQDYFYQEFSFASEYCPNLGGLGVQTSRRHHGSSSSGTSCGPGGGDRVINPRQQKRYTSSVSSRQREGGSLPSNVNVDCPFFNEVGHHHTTGTITKFKKREGGAGVAKSDYGAMMLTAPLTSAGAAEIISAVAEAAGSTGLCGGMKNTESQLIDDCGGGVVGAGHTVIDMGELESDETQHLLAHDSMQQNNLYDSGLDDLDGSGGDLYVSSTNTSTDSNTTSSIGSAGGCSSVLKKIPRFPTASYTSHAKLEIGEPSSTVRPSSVHHVDKTVSLPLLESNKNVDITPIQLGSSYQAVKCFMSSDNSKSDQTKHVMMGISGGNTKYITTQNFNQIISQPKYLDENGNSVQQFNSGLGSSSSSGGGGGSGASGNNSSSVGGITGGKKNRKPKSDRNTVLVIPENIAGYRGNKDDIESLVDYIENKDKQKDAGGKGGGGSGATGSGPNPKNGTVMKTSGGVASNGSVTSGVENNVVEEKAPKKKNDKKKDKAKLKKSNSLEELSSCSRKKQQAEEEQTTQPNDASEEQQGPSLRAQEADSAVAVTLRNNKGNKKNQNAASVSVASSTSSASSTTSSQSSKDTSSAANSGKRGERRSWGTEELSYLVEDNAQQNVSSGAGMADKSEEKSSKKENKKEAKDIAEPIMPTFNLLKKRDSLRMSVESLSAVSAGGGAETAEFHVVTKKKKMKKKSPGLFAEEGSTSSSVGYGSSTTNRRHLSASHSYSIGGNAGGRNANIAGKYQTSNNFTNDRDIYMNSLASSSDVSRRKSTSSVPPSEKSDSSDADSVQSLPIEPSRKQQSGQSNRNSAGVPQSYADIARIPNADKINNNLLNSSMSSSTSPLDSSSVEKWPPVQTASEDLFQALKSPSAFPELVPEQSTIPQSQQQLPNQQQQQQQQQQYQHQYVNSSVNSISSNNVGISNKATYSQSLLIAATTKAAAVAAEEDDFGKQHRSVTVASGKLVNSVNTEHSVNSSNINSSSSSKLALHKSKSVDNNDIYYSNEHYPALEKTVKAAKVVSAVTNNNSSNSLLEPKGPSIGKVSPVSLTGQPNSTLPYAMTPPSVPSVSTTHNNVTNAITGAKKSKKKDYSAASNNFSSPNEVESINNARNVAAVQTSLDTINNNNSVLIETADVIVNSEFAQNNGMINRSPNGELNLQQNPQSTPKNSCTANAITTSSTCSSSSVSSANAIPTKRGRKEKSTSCSSGSGLPVYATQSNSASAANASAAGTVTANTNHRPAVIIMNDNNEPNPKHEFTFGFDIDQELLFGDFQEDEVSMLDHQHQQQPQQYLHDQQKPSHHYHHQVYNSIENDPSTGSNTSTDYGYSSIQPSSTATTSPSSSSSQQYNQQHQHSYHSHNPAQQQMEPYDMLTNSTDPDTYRDSIEHKFHQPPPSMMLPPVPLYSQPPPQLPPPHVLAAQQQHQQQQQSRQPRSAANAAPPASANHYNLPPPPVISAGHHQQQQLPPLALPIKQDSATNTPPMVSATSPPAIITVPPPPLPPAVQAIPLVAAVVPVVPAAAIPGVVSQQTSPVVILPVSISNIASAVVVSGSNTSLVNQTSIAAVAAPASSCGSSSSSSGSTAAPQQQEQKPQRQLQNSSTPTAPQQQQQQQQFSFREKMKEINLRFIAPEQLQTNHNHDKIVNFVGMAWEDIICIGSAKYYDGQ